jgi:hypothetical protein
VLLVLVVVVVVVLLLVGISQSYSSFPPSCLVQPHLNLLFCLYKV